MLIDCNKVGRGRETEMDHSTDDKLGPRKENLRIIEVLRGRSLLRRKKWRAPKKMKGKTLPSEN
jgi:hypothetical protein